MRMLQYNYNEASNYHIILFTSQDLLKLHFMCKNEHTITILTIEQPCKR